MNHENYQCECGESWFTVYRKGGFKRKIGHIKHLYCFKCEKVKPFTYIAEDCEQAIKTVIEGGAK